MMRLPAPAQAEALARLGHAANSTEADFRRALLLFECSHALMPRRTTLLSAANMGIKLGRRVLGGGGGLVSANYPTVFIYSLVVKLYC